MTQVEIVKKFIEDNKLDFSGRGSELNGNCTALAGFICYVLDKDPDNYLSSHGYEIISELDISTDAAIELERVFEYAYNNYYEKFWKTPAAKKEYIL